MTTLRTVFFLAFLGLTSATAQQRPLDGFDAYVAKAVTDWRVPGLAIVVVKDDSVLLLKGYGVRELGKPNPVTVHTRFGNMSTTKAFTAMLVAMLADSGRLAFDDPVQKYEPAVQFADPFVTREITVRDLLTHAWASAIRTTCGATAASTSPPSYRACGLCRPRPASARGFSTTMSPTP